MKANKCKTVSQLNVNNQKERFPFYFDLSALSDSESSFVPESDKSKINKPSIFTNSTDSLDQSKNTTSFTEIIAISSDSAIQNEVSEIGYIPKNIHLDR